MNTATTISRCCFLAPDLAGFSEEFHSLDPLPVQESLVHDEDKTITIDCAKMELSGHP